MQLKLDSYVCYLDNCLCGCKMALKLLIVSRFRSMFPIHAFAHPREICQDSTQVF